jgi:hypothetical protein
MSIPTFMTDEWRVSIKFPDSDVVQIIRDEMADSDEEDGDHDHDLERTDVEGCAQK